MPTQKLHRMNLRIPVLSRMADDVQNGGSLRRSTAILMWSAYAAHAAVTVWALAKPDKQLKSPRWAIPVGWAAAAGGAGLCVAAMSRFASAAEVEEPATTPSPRGVSIATPATRSIWDTSSPWAARRWSA